jgi:ABC-type uncharacterized transport system ATPase subunit
MSDAALELQGLSKSFDKKVVDNLDLRVAPGEEFDASGDDAKGLTGNPSFERADKPKNEEK